MSLTSDNLRQFGSLPCTTEIVNFDLNSSELAAFCHKRLVAHEFPELCEEPVALLQRKIETASPKVFAGGRLDPVQRSYIAGASGLCHSFDYRGFATNEKLPFLGSCVYAGDLRDGSGRKGLVLPVALYGDSKLPESPGRIIRQRAAATITIAGPSVFSSSQKACLEAVYWLAPGEQLGRRRTPCRVFLLEWGLPDQTPTKAPGKYVALNAARGGKGKGKLVELSPGGTRGKINWREESVSSLSVQPTRLNCVIKLRLIPDSDQRPYGIHQLFVKVHIQLLNGRSARHQSTLCCRQYV